MTLSRAAALWMLLLGCCLRFRSCPAVSLPPAQFLARAVVQAGNNAEQETTTTAVGDEAPASEAPRSSQFDSESYLQQVFNAQKHVTHHSFPVKTILGVKLRGATLVYILTARKSGLAHISTPSKESFFLPRILQSPAWTTVFVGKDADCRQAEKWVEHLQHNRQDHIPLVGKELAMLLADRAHRSTLHPRRRSQAVNAMVLCADPRSAGDLLTVDVSANYYFCRSGALGLYSDELCAWLQLKGRQRAASLSAQLDSSADDLDHCFQIVDEAVASQAELFDCIRSGQVGVHALTWWGGTVSRLTWIPTALFGREQSSLDRSFWWKRHALIPADTPDEDCPRWFQLSAGLSSKGSGSDQREGNNE